MKLAITGKGGVGKTTLAALLAQGYADQGRDVLAVDVDPSPCLAGALGFPDELRARLRPIVEMDALIEERTGAKPGTTGGFFTLNPRVDDLPARFSVLHRGVRLGIGDQRRIRQALIGALEASPHFSDVRFDAGVVRDNRNEGRDRFQLSAEVRRRGAAGQGA